MMPAFQLMVPALLKVRRVRDLVLPAKVLTVEAGRLKVLALETAAIVPPFQLKKPLTVNAPPPLS
jgi:hypothetical protein